MKALGTVAEQVAHYNAQGALNFLQGVIDAAKDKRRGKDAKQFNECSSQYIHGYTHEYNSD